jgi:hypothetical protein
MGAQLRHLTAVARLPHVTVQIVPATAHAGLLGGFTVTDKAAYAESVMRGQVGHPGNLGGRETWEDAGSWRHRRSIPMSCANAR